jgi:protein-S-isoprenylcysteine O-methyltransferase Ste14
MRRSLVLGYGVVAYVFFLVSFLYFVGFLGNMFVSKTIDSTPVAGALRSTVTNISLIGLFALQHLIMARSWFKTWWTRFVPKPVERSTFVLFASIILLVLVIFWQPVPRTIWKIDNPILSLVPLIGFLLGCGLVVHATFLIDHWDLFGLRQVYLYFRGRPYTPVPFKVHSLYMHVRHPMMLGFLMVLWSTPVMSVGRFTLAVGFTLFILIGIWLEERELTSYFGQVYSEYKKKTSMLLPRTNPDSHHN